MLFSGALLLVAREGGRVVNIGGELAHLSIKRQDTISPQKLNYNNTKQT